VVRYGSKNGYQIDMCSKEVGLCDQNMLTILGPSQYDWGNLYDYLMSTRIFTLIMNKIFKNNEANDYGHELDLLIILQ
jgi:hypothetical protein